MSPRRRHPRNQGLPDGLRVRAGYYSYVHPIDGREKGIGRDRDQAIQWAQRANAVIQKIRNGELTKTSDQPPPAPEKRKPAEHLPWIERIRLASSHIQTLEIAALRSLPCESPEWGQGIYFLWLGDSLQYIGKSKCIQERIAQHRDAQAIAFDRYTCLLVNSGPDEFFVDRSTLLRDHERAYIARYPTPHNSRHYTPRT